MVRLREDETLGDLLIGGLKLIQKKKGFRFTLDSVLLAHFATIKKGDRVVDLGTGTGIIPVILSTRADLVQAWGVEIQEEIAEMAARSVHLNKLEKSIIIHQGDIRDIHKTLGGGVYTLVTANPPYWSEEEGRASSMQSRALARHEIAGALNDYVNSASKLLNYQGRFALIHSAKRLPEIFDVLRKYQMEPRRIRFVHAFLGKDAQQVLIEARKKAPSGLKVLPPLIVYEGAQRYGREILHWYGREGNDDRNE